MASAEDPSSPVLTAGERNLVLRSVRQRARHVGLAEEDPLVPNRVLLSACLGSLFCPEGDPGGDSTGSQGALHGDDGGVRCADVCLLTDDGGHLLAHKVILSCRCGYFEGLFRFRALSSESRPSTPTLGTTLGKTLDTSLGMRMMEIQLHGVSERCLTEILHWVYTARLRPGLDAEVLMEIVFISDEYLLHQCMRDAAAVLLGHLSTQTCIDVLRLGTTFALPALQIGAARFILDHFVSLIASGAIAEAGLTARGLAVIVLSTCAPQRTQQVHGS